MLINFDLHKMHSDSLEEIAMCDEIPLNSGRLHWILVL